MIRIKLPRGLVVSAPSGADVRFIYAEIFEQRCYERFGITLAKDATIVDVGANIGLFALRMKQLAPAARVVCVEPIPPTFACLASNLASLPGVVCLPLALSDHEGSVSITFYPASPGSSTSYPDHKATEADALARAATLRWLWQFDKLASIVAGLLYPLRRALLRIAFRRLFKQTETFSCPTSTLDQLWAQQGLTQVDLLKIDVEGAEPEVLAGLSDATLSRVRQLVIEISPQHKHWLPTLESRLRAAGFSRLHLDAMIAGSDPRSDDVPCNLFALR